MSNSQFFHINAKGEVEYLQKIGAIDSVIEAKHYQAKRVNEMIDTFGGVADASNRECANECCGECSRG